MRTRCIAPSATESHGCVESNTDTPLIRVSAFTMRWQGQQTGHQQTGGIVGGCHMSQPCGGADTTRDMVTPGGPHSVYDHHVSV